MKKSLSLVLFGVGMALAIPCPALAQADNLHLHSTAPAGAFSVRHSPGGQGNGSADSAYPASAANNANAVQDGALTAAVNTAKATLAGTLTLVLLQRRYRHEIVLRSRS